MLPGIDARPAMARKAWYRAFLQLVAGAVALCVPAWSQINGRPTVDTFVIPAGDRLLLRLRHDVSTRSARKGQIAELEVIHGLLLGNGHALPAGLTVRATITQSHRRRPVAILDRPELRIRFDELVLPDGTNLSIPARVLRAGFLEVDSNKREFGIKGEGHSPRVMVMVAGTAARGAILAGPVGAAAMATVSLITLSGTRSRDVKLPRGLVFEIETADDLRIPFDTAGLVTWTPSNAALAPEEPLRAAARRGAGTGKAPDRDVVLAPNPESPVPGAPRPSDPPVPASAWTVRVDVDLVTVESVVRDSGGRLMEHLQKEDFRVFEDGVEKSLGHFSQDQLPLAVALVVDRSGSVARHRGELRQAALATLGQLKPDDRVALFSFADVPTRLSDLTEDRASIGDLLFDLEPTGGTNIYDAVFDAAHYLSMAAPDRRRVVILISDNQANTLGRANESGAIRMALETETVVYSIKTQGTPSPAGNIKPAASQLEHTSIWICDPDSVLRIANETGGEMLDGSSQGLFPDALAAVIARLKLRYTLGYAPGASARDGRFHRIEVKLVDRFGRPGEAYTVHARRGFYAKLP